MILPFGKRLKQIRKEKNLTLEKLATIYNDNFKGGLSKGTLSKYENGKQEPMLYVAAHLSKILDVSLDYLIGNTNNPIRKETIKNELDKRERAHIKNYRVLNEFGKDKADERVQELTEIPRYINNIIDIQNYITCAYYDPPVSAGTGVVLADEIKSTITIKKSNISLKADYAVKVRGDSMEPMLFDEDIILVKSTPCVEINEIGIFFLNDNVFVKKYGRTKLISLNKKYKPIILNGNDRISCLGKVLGVAEVVDV